MIKHVVAVIFFVLLIVSMIVFSPTREEGQWYDCRLAEISPDYPLEVKEACRNIRHNQQKQSDKKIIYL